MGDHHKYPQLHYHHHYGHNHSTKLQDYHNESSLLVKLKKICLSFMVAMTVTATPHTISQTAVAAWGTFQICFILRIQMAVKCGRFFVVPHPNSLRTPQPAIFTANDTESVGTSRICWFCVCVCVTTPVQCCAKRRNKEIPKCANCRLQSQNKYCYFILCENKEKIFLPLPLLVFAATLSTVVIMLIIIYLWLPRHIALSPAVCSWIFCFNKLELNVIFSHIVVVVSLVF